MELLFSKQSIEITGSPSEEHQEGLRMSGQYQEPTPFLRDPFPSTTDPFPSTPANGREVTRIEPDF